MTDSNKGLKVMDRKAADNEYLHKDFHGGLCYGIKYLDENFGQDATTEYLQQVGLTFFKPLSEALKEQGLAALEKHWNDIFTKEDGKFSMKYENDTLVLTVEQCPAVAHLKSKNLFCTERFCQTTAVVNEKICRQAGYQSSCEYEPGKGRCVQKFWKTKE